jgi:colicin import membrane protein
LRDALASEKAAANVLDSMTSRITRSWRRPVAYKGGLEVFLRTSLASNGELVDVRVVKTSGDASFDRSALTAVKRAAPFGEVAQFDAATFEEKFRSLTIKFRPED